ncbi:MAG: hypothetical protein GX568_05335 [Candidatus Gastranaerophilales bacterium]|nr:hypothetical protein [Candidatus Gastranaerophilales bacterium]
MKVGKISPFVRKVENFISNPKCVGAVVTTYLAGTWAAQTHMDVKRAAKDDKKNVLINNIIIGAGMGAGAGVWYLLPKVFMKKNAPPLKPLSPSKVQENIKKFLGYFPKEAVWQSVGIPLCSGLFGGVAGEIAQRTFPIKYESEKTVLDRADKIIESASKDKGVFKGLPNVNLPHISRDEFLQEINPAFSNRVGMDIGRERGIDNKVRKFVSTMIGTIFLPVAAILPLSTVLTNKFPNKKGAINALAIGASLGTSFVGAAIADRFNEKITNAILEGKIIKKANMMIHKLTMDKMFASTQAKKQTLDGQIEKLKDIKKKVAKNKGNLRQTVSDLSKKELGFGKPREKNAGTSSAMRLNA